MKIKTGLYAVAIIIALMATACKPTEKGYKAAYDAALGKRQQTMVDFDPNLPAEGLQLSDGPMTREINGRKVFVLNERLSLIEPGQGKILPYNVAVGCYKMPTNCKAQVRDLINEGFQAFGTKTADEKFYVIVSSFETLGEAADFVASFTKKGDRAFVGLPDAPVIIEN